MKKTEVSEETWDELLNPRYWCIYISCRFFELHPDSVVGHDGWRLRLSKDNKNNNSVFSSI